MAHDRYEWPLVDQFVNRTDELAALQNWWEDTTPEPMAILGRRRVGKSWLFRRFAHMKAAEILVAEQLTSGAMLHRFADQLTPRLGVRPSLPDVATLIRTLYQAAGNKKILVVIDEFPLLLGTSAPEAERLLTSVQAVMEEAQQSSQLKLILCGSHVSTMEALFTEKNPLHGRLRRLEVRPLTFPHASGFLTDHEPTVAFERYAVTGGMPMYLSQLAPGSLRGAVCSKVLDRDAPLWNEGRALVEQELREPRVYFSLLEQLSRGAREVNEISQAAGVTAGTTTKYLDSLRQLRLVSRAAPFAAGPTQRSGRWQLDDPFLRFWFRFVFPFQSDLEAGLAASTLYDNEIGPFVSEHVAPVFESWCQQWLRTHRPHLVTSVGSWWGNAANEFRRTRERSSEEIDAIGSLRKTVSLVAEAKWTNRPLGPGVLRDLQTYKLPALRQSGLRVADQPHVVLFSKAGYTPSLVSAASEDERIELVDVPAELAAATPAC